jgi:hypothetical protein
MSAPSPPLFPVTVNDAILPRALPDRNVVFHGVNKSGSLAMADVLRAAYFASGRANQFFSTYHKIPWMQDDQDNPLPEIIQSSTPNGTLFISHYLYGAFDEARARALLITQFRHPVARIVSIHSWLRKFHASGYGGPEGFPTLQRFAETSNGISHSQISQLAVGYGKGWRERIHKLTAAQMLELALEAIDRKIAWFGLAELFEESIFTFAALCGLRSVPSWAKDDRNAERMLVAELPADSRAAIEFHYEAEIEFYRQAKAMFMSRIGKLDFGADLGAYRTACAGQYKERLAE